LSREQLREPPARLGRHVALRRRGLEQLDHLARGAIDVLLDEREEEVALAREVPVHGSLRVAGALGHLVDRGIAEAALGEDVGRRAKQLLSRVAAPRACDAAAPVDARLVRARGAMCLWYCIAPTDQSVWQALCSLPCGTSPSRPTASRRAGRSPTSRSRIACARWCQARTSPSRCG